MKAFQTILLAVLVALANGQDLPKECDGAWNTNPIVTSNPVFVKSVPYGKLYVVRTVTPPISVIHLYGNHYQMGYAMGKLMTNELKSFSKDAMEYMVNKVAGLLEQYAHIPNEISYAIASRVMEVGLQATVDLTTPFTPKHFFDELKGISDATGISYTLISQINQIPEFTKAACSMIGSWGQALSRARMGSTLFQLRALDWETEGPFNDYPAVIVYHPDPMAVPGAMPFATFGWPGFVGTVTGYSSASVGISEKFWTWGDYNGSISSIGIPFQFLLRDILEFDVDSSAALNRIYKAERTCPIFIGLGDNNLNQFRAVEYGHDYIKVFSDVSFPQWEAHPRHVGVVYIQKDNYPSHDRCVPQLVERFYGQLDAEHIMNISAAHDTGSTHAAIYDFAQSYMYVVSASSARVKPVVHATARPWLRLDMQKLWMEKRP